MAFPLRLPPRPQLHLFSGWQLSSLCERSRRRVRQRHQRRGSTDLAQRSLVPSPFHAVSSKSITLTARRCFRRLIIRGPWSARLSTCRSSTSSHQAQITSSLDLYASIMNMQSRAADCRISTLATFSPGRSNRWSTFRNNVSFERLLCGQCLAAVHGRFVTFLVHVVTSPNAWVDHI